MTNSPRNSNNTHVDPDQGNKTRINLAWWVLRIGLGAGPIITGIDKFFNRLTDWGMYLSPVATRLIPVNATTFMHAVGLIEILAGLIVLSRWTKLGSYIVMLWLVGIALNLVATGMFYDLAMRDMEIALGAFALSQLSALREQSTARQASVDPSPNSQLAAAR
jgi:uncharacterized membrane protein YphA (DoxX/SURF4 family)